MFVLTASTIQAQRGILDGNASIGIDNLEVFDDQGGVTVYDVDFGFKTARNVYGANLDGFPFTGGNADEDAFAALVAIGNVLDANVPVPSRAGVPRQDVCYIRS